VFYDKFYSLCQERGVTPTQIARDLGIRQSTISMWKKQGTTPRYDTSKKLADYFGVTVDYLLGSGSICAQIHLENGVHIYRNSLPFDYPFDDTIRVLYEDEHIIIAVDRDSPATQAELDTILDAYVPKRGKKDIAKHSDSRNRIRIDEAVNQMTPEGQSKVADYAEDILPRYRIETALQSPPAPQEGTDTTPPPEGAEGPGEGE